MLITRLLLVLEVWDGIPTCRKSWAGNLLVVLWTSRPTSKSAHYKLGPRQTRPTANSAHCKLGPLQAWGNFLTGINLTQGQGHIIKNSEKIYFLFTRFPQKVLRVGQPNLVCTFLREESRRQSILGSVRP